MAIHLKSVSGGPLVLDGGLATELEATGLKLQGDPLWSARLLHTNPKAVKDAHFRFLCSGSDVVTAATYQASIQGFITHLGVNPGQAWELISSGVRLAREAVERFTADNLSPERQVPLVAGSVGPYGAFLHDGSEYTGVYAEEMSVEELKAWHRPQVQCLVAAGADLLAMETIPSVKEGAALVELLREFPNAAAWLSFSCKDERCVSDGRPFTEAVQVACMSRQVVGVGVNCCPPGLVTPLLASAATQKTPDFSWVAYPNSGEGWDVESGWRSSENIVPIEELCVEWMNQGATLIGGCCRIYPAQIAALRQHIHRALGVYRTAV